MYSPIQAKVNSEGVRLQISVVQIGENRQSGNSQCRSRSGFLPLFQIALLSYMLLEIDLIPMAK